LLYLLDTADTETIARLMDLYPICGVTTNPTIAAREKKPFGDVIAAIRRLIGPERQLHAQVVSPTAEGMAAEACLLAERIGGDFYAKVPVTPQGIKAMRLISARGISVTATAVFTVQQAMLAGRAGASFVAPYVNRLDELQGDGPGLVGELVKTFKTHGMSTQVLAASFKNADQVQRCCAGGAQAVTLAPGVLEALLWHPLTDKGVAKFMEDWEAAYGPGRTTVDA